MTVQQVLEVTEARIKFLQDSVNAKRAADRNRYYFEIMNMEYAITELRQVRMNLKSTFDEKEISD